MKQKIYKYYIRHCKKWLELGALAIQDLPHERLMSMWRSADKEPVVGDDRSYGNLGFFRVQDFCRTEFRGLSNYQFNVIPRVPYLPPKPNSNHYPKP